jgi:hypothetical protein
MAESKSCGSITELKTRSNWPRNQSSFFSQDWKAKRKLVCPLAVITSMTMSIDTAVVETFLISTVVAVAVGAMVLGGKDENRRRGDEVLPPLENKNKPPGTTSADTNELVTTGAGRPRPAGATTGSDDPAATKKVRSRLESAKNSSKFVTCRLLLWMGVVAAITVLATATLAYVWIPKLVHRHLMNNGKGIVRDEVLDLYACLLSEPSKFRETYDKSFRRGHGEIVSSYDYGAFDAESFQGLDLQTFEEIERTYTLNQDVDHICAKKLLHIKLVRTHDDGTNFTVALKVLHSRDALMVILDVGFLAHPARMYLALLMDGWYFPFQGLVSLYSGETTTPPGMEEKLNKLFLLYKYLQLKTNLYGNSICLNEKKDQIIQMSTFWEQVLLQFIKHGVFPSEDTLADKRNKIRDMLGE